MQKRMVLLGQEPELLVVAGGQELCLPTLHAHTNSVLLKVSEELHSS